MALIERAIGLIPAAGHATRMGALPYSKELLPVGVDRDSPDGPSRMRPVCLELIGAFRQSGIRRAVVIVRSGKWDIPAFLGNGKREGVDLGYAVMEHPYGAPFTLDAAYPFVRDAPVALGFPDTLFEPAVAFRTLFERLDETGAVMALGLFPVADPRTTDMVETDGRGRVTALHVKPRSTTLTHAWCIAAWRPDFTEFLHRWVAAQLATRAPNALAAQEWYVGQVIQEAIASGLFVVGMPVSDVPFRDLGTPEALLSAIAQRGTGVSGKGPSHE